MDKKIYSTPFAEYVDVTLPPCMSDIISPGVTTDKENLQDLRGNSIYGADENIGGSWENIWNE